MMLHVFSCSYNQINHTKRSVESILSAIEATRACPIEYNIIDNNSKDGSQEFLLKHSNKININLNNKNMGKAVATNIAIKEAAKRLNKDSVLFLVDSDIRLTDLNFFNEFLEIWSKIKTQVSAIVCNQDGNSLMKRDFVWRESKDFSYFVPSEGYGSGIAGGAMFVPYEYWLKVKGYRENTGPKCTPSIYGSNDGLLMLDLWTKTLKPITIIKDLEVYHPFEENKDYQKWKIMQHNALKENGHSVATKGFFDDEQKL